MPSYFAVIVDFAAYHLAGSLVCYCIAWWIFGPKGERLGWRDFVAILLVAVSVGTIRYFSAWVIGGKRAGNPEGIDGVVFNLLLPFAISAVWILCARPLRLRRAQGGAKPSAAGPPEMPDAQNVGPHLQANIPVTTPASLPPTSKAPLSSSSRRVAGLGVLLAVALIASVALFLAQDTTVHLTCDVSDEAHPIHLVVDPRKQQVNGMSAVVNEHTIQWVVDGWTLKVHRYTGELAGKQSDGGGSVSGVCSIAKRKF